MLPCNEVECAMAAKTSYLRPTENENFRYILLIHFWVTNFTFRLLGQARQWRDLRSSELVDRVQKDEKRPLHCGELEQLFEVSCDWNLQRDSSQSMTLRTFARRSFTFDCLHFLRDDHSSSTILSTIFFPQPCRPGYLQREACLCSKSAGRSTWVWMKQVFCGKTF